MKLFLVLLTLAGAYLFAMLQTTNAVLGQTSNLQAAYQSAAENADAMTAGQ